MDKCWTTFVLRTVAQNLSKISQMQPEHMQDFFLDFRRYVLRTVAQNLSNVSQMRTENMQEHFLNVRRDDLRTVAQNVSKVSQMHPENMQEHLLRFSTSCSARSSPELVKSIPNAPRKYARLCFDIFDVRFCAQ